MCIIEGCADPAEVGIWWRDDEEWVEYDASNTALITEALARGEKRVQLGSIISWAHQNGNNYVLDLQAMKQVNLESGFVRPIKIIQEGEDNEEKEGDLNGPKVCYIDKAGYAQEFCRQAAEEILMYAAAGNQDFYKMQHLPGYLLATDKKISVLCLPLIRKSTFLRYDVIFKNFELVNEGTKTSVQMQVLRKLIISLFCDPQIIKESGSSWRSVKKVILNPHLHRFFKTFINTLAQSVRSDAKLRGEIAKALLDGEVKGMERLKFVFHGTSEENIESILSHGIDPRKSRYGSSCYFGLNPQVSSQYCKSVGGGSYRMLVFLAVITPEICDYGTYIMVENYTDNLLPIAEMEFV